MLFTAITAMIRTSFAVVLIVTRVVAVTQRQADESKRPHLTTQQFPYLVKPPQHPQQRHKFSKIAFIVPYRNRPSDLKHFLRVVERERAHLPDASGLDSLSVFIIDQDDHLPFNRGALLNIGFRMANESQHRLSNAARFRCFIFHDVDLQPEHADYRYGCQHEAAAGVRHNAAWQSKFDYRLPYGNYVGGVLSVTERQMARTRGHANRYFGWGGEDDDFARRILAVKVGIERPHPGDRRQRFYSPRHDTHHEPIEEHDEADETLRQMGEDGVHTVKYKVKEVISIGSTSENVFHVKVELDESMMTK